MSESVSTFGFDNEEIKSGIYEKYKGTKNQTDRCGIIYSDPKAMFAGSKIHYYDPAKKYFICKKGDCCDKLGPSKWRVGAVIIKYGTDKQGNIKKPFNFEVLPWVFGEGTYLKLKTVNSEFPLATHDIKISCTNEEFQHLDITPCNETIWTAKDELKAMILEQAKPIWESVKRSIAHDLSVEEIKELLGSGTSSGSTSIDPSAGLDLDSVLNKV